MSIELSIVIPTFNEVANIVSLLDKLRAVLSEVEWEAVFVDDDSSDGTAELLRKLASTNPRIRLIHRIGRRGLASACIEGFLSSSAPYLAVMDADLQHDEALLPRMFGALREGKLDVVIGSRYVAGGSVGEWSESRHLGSRLATRLTSIILPCELSDPMSGFFMMTAEFFYGAVRRVSGLGFKLLLDLIVSSHRPIRYAEIPYTFRPRTAGASKLSTKVVLEFVELILEKTIPPAIPPRFVLFVLVGLTGAIGHLVLFISLYVYEGWSFLASQAMAAFCTITINFSLNNALTYKDVALRGWRFAGGLLGFYLICAAGGYLNLQIAASLKNSGIVFWAASLIGALVGGLWNYSLSSVWTWRHSMQK
jgi:dolichol-phosphate mannosyltransferase